MVKTTMDEQGIKEMAIVAVEHPIAGRNPKETIKFADAEFPNIYKAATAWQPTK